MLLAEEVLEKYGE